MFLLRTPRGAFGRVGTVLPLAEFVDGMSSTIAFAEKRLGSGPGRPYNPTRDWIDGVGVETPGGMTADDWVMLCSSLDAGQMGSAQLDAGRYWLLYGARFSTFFASVPPNSAIPDCGNAHINGEGVFAARSYHPGGVNVAMADGSVRWVASSIAVPTWRALGTRDGGEVVDPGSY